MGINKLNVIIGSLLFIALLVVAEIFVRTQSISRHIAFHPAELVNDDIFSAKINALEGVDAPIAVLIGDSVAFGKTMSGYGYDNWQERELSAKLNERLAENGTALRVANYASDGLTPADFSAIIDRAIKAEVDVVILVVGLRGFSKSFEARDERYSYGWGKTSGGKNFTKIVNKYWQTKPALEFGLSELVGGPLNSVLTRIRKPCYSGKCESQMPLDGIQILQMKRRLAGIEINPDVSFQAKELSNGLKALDGAGIPVIVVYATENPAVVSAIIKPEQLQKARSELLTLITHANPNSIYFLPDTSLTKDMYVDHMHLTPDGYGKMADRLAPVLIKKYR